MGTFSVRGARSLALVLVALLLVNGDAASTHRGFQDTEASKLLWQDWANMTADTDANELLLRGMLWANNETDPVYAPIARRMKAVGATYGNARWWLSWRCPRRERNGTLSRIARRCYVRGLRSLEKEALLKSRPPPQETPEQEARRRVWSS
ncbi:hypothetical protein PVAP13_5NG541900 [Panicum virgatum]|uniref:Uncharacterized protein n=1 Tax=Panicum virgatum TaxID=38727 RepID=A0A8T0S774_PANVG|nr:hypothetical protein PVAP13_5NG541900 [Panicum virgatum]